MTNTKDLLNRVNIIIENSEGNTLTEIKNISDILEVNGKVATILHFINKDSEWNPHTITLLDDLLKEEKLTEGMSQEKMDFYLLNYLDKNWGETLVKRLREAKGFNYVSHWLSSTITDIIQDVKKLGLYPDETDSLFGKAGSGPEVKNYKQLFGDGSMFLYGPFVDWVHGVVKSEEKHGLKLDNDESSKTFFDVTPHEDY